MYYLNTVMAKEEKCFRFNFRASLYRLPEYFAGALFFGVLF